MNRIPFGNETNLFTPADSCLACDTRRGQHHEYGCPLERCPSCDKRLIKCKCLALSIAEGMKLTAAISDNLTRDEALKILDTEETINSTYELRGAFSWTCNNAPPQYREEMLRVALEIVGGRRQGDKIIVPLSKAAACLGVTEEEAAPIMEGLETECLYPGWDGQTGREQ